jgi:hypothetical protein
MLRPAQRRGRMIPESTPISPYLIVGRRQLKPPRYRVLRIPAEEASGSVSEFI